MQNKNRVNYEQRCMLLRTEYYDVLKKLGLNIAYYRKLRGYSQSKLAELVNISRTHMSRIETAECAVSITVLIDLCSVLSVSLTDIFDFKE